MRVTPRFIAFLVGFSGPLAAQSLNIDFDKDATSLIYQGLAAAPDPTGNTAIWNSVYGSGTTTISMPNLVDSSGNSTSVGISLGINGSYVSAPGQQENGGAGLAYQSLMSDYVFLAATTNSEVLTKNGLITGLDPLKLYDIYLYAQGDNFLGEYSDGQNALITINGVSKQTSWDGVVGGDGFLVEGIEYVRFRVSPNASGQVNFSYSNVVTGVNALSDLDGLNSRFAVINGIQIVDLSLVPEPSVALLSAAGLLVISRRRRR
ncbi:MAG: PEP-CTERM sorting domain-containing protein [Verrucomicrobiaceae bacterium]|nr:MAG: PEP-CTERM sorting domain-containing protein [Verrucomicrobiaceae bacterium]